MSEVVGYTCAIQGSSNDTAPESDERYSQRFSWIAYFQIPVSIRARREKTIRRRQAHDASMDLDEVFDRAASQYESVFFTRLGERLVEGAGVRAGQHVLDLGCGTGACAIPAALAAGPGGHVTGIDFSAAMLDRARQASADRGLANVDFRDGDAAAPAFPDEAFDVVLAGLVVFMLPDPVDALARYARLLRPGGILGMSTFGEDDPRFFDVTNAVLPYLEGPMPPIPGRDASPLRTVAGITGVVQGAGFTGVKVDDANIDLEFASAREWWAWLWQTAGRVVLERIPTGRLDEAQAAAEERMDDVKAKRGGYIVRWNVRFSYGVR